jgi:hypothetical protein
LDFVEDPLQMSRTKRQLKITAIPSLKRTALVTCHERPSAKVLYCEEASKSTYLPVQTPTVEMSSGIAEMEQTKSTPVVCVDEGIIQYFKMIWYCMFLFIFLGFSTPKTF